MKQRYRNINKCLLQYICMYIYIYIYICVCVYVYVYACIYMYIYRTSSRVAGVLKLHETLMWRPCNETDCDAKLWYSWIFKFDAKLYRVVIRSFDIFFLSNKLERTVELHVIGDTTTLICMMTSLNGKIFRVTGHLCGEFTGHRWIPLRKASDSELWCFLWSAPK